MDFIDRLKEAMLKRNVNATDLANAAGVSVPAATKWVNGPNKPKWESAKKIAKLLDVDPDWLMGGEGKSQNDVIEGTSRRMDDGMTIEQMDPRPVHGWDDTTPVDPDEIAVPFFKDFPVSCGSGTIGEAVLQNEHRRLRLSRATIKSYGVDPELVIVVTAHGNSNFPDIKNKASVHVELRKREISEITDGCYYEINHGGSHFFKMLYRLPGGGVRVVSRNKEEYPEYSLTKEQIESEGFTIEAYAFDVQNPLPRE